MDKRWLLPQYFYETQVPDAILGAAYSYAKGMTYNKEDRHSLTYIRKTIYPSW